ncbi:PucR family transcriptional regulator [Desulfitobacterium chlororespirans]|uniref:Transcriptional regulator, CdaR family n=1 Tax=Desulfitobacterium chlororespirans DSM 11544 TaxID=1121395 RepID=A0A1M7TYG4_9FIRM|nr:helix-turn-helix domain-containing protein [Desulfitobacterium chlororespirans]SHN75812.1 transcriptional regulator, CdaR family [Desulfitobacterium chlororespirans DSM 11544]
MNKQFSVPDYMQELVMASGQGLDLLTHTLAKVINRPVLVSTSAYKLVASSSHYDCEFLQVELDDPQSHSESLFLCYISAGTFKVRAIGRAIAPLGRVIGYIFILSDEDNPDKEAIQPLLDYTSSLYAVHLQSRLELKQEQSKFKNAFLYDLLYGNLKRSEDIIATGEIWGWNFQCPHTVMVFLLPDPDHHNSDHHHPKHHLMDFLSRIIEQTFIDNYYKNPALILRQNELVILIPLQADKPALQKGEILGFAEKISSQIKTTELNNLVTCGVGQVYSDSTELFRSYQEAKVAFEMGKLLEIPVPFFSELGLERILYKHDLQDLKEYYLHVLGELHKQDDPESSLIALLESFAENQFDVNKTAKAIFMHPNTLRYRLNKIENILGKPLTDNHTRLDIMAALKIKRLHTIEKLLA